MKKAFFILFKIILIIILIICMYEISVKVVGYFEAVNTGKIVREIYYNKEKPLSDINSDYKCWINIENTNIDYPVVQSEDNDYYLKRNFFNKKNYSGSVFFDFRVDKNSRNAILYAHNMKDGTMFANIEKFKNKDFFDENNKIIIEKDGVKYEYEVFSVYYLSGKENAHLKTHFGPNEEFRAYLDTAKARSLFESKRELNNNEILTISTCSYEFKDCRTVVHAQLDKIKMD